MRRLYGPVWSWWLPGDRNVHIVAEVGLIGAIRCTSRVAAVGVAEPTANTGAEATVKRAATIRVVVVVQIAGLIARRIVC